MSNMNERISAYLGDMSPASFESEEQIREYFSPENLSRMFGDETDFSDADDVMECILMIWRKDGTGRINKEWYEDCKHNGWLHEEIESWFCEIGNKPHHITDDLSVWTRDYSSSGPGIWLSQDRIDEICARIDAQ